MKRIFLGSMPNMVFEDLSEILSRKKEDWKHPVLRKIFGGLSGECVRNQDGSIDLLADSDQITTALLFQHLARKHDLEEHIAIHGSGHCLFVNKWGMLRRKMSFPSYDKILKEAHDSLAMLSPADREKTQAEFRNRKLTNSSGDAHRQLGLVEFGEKDEKWRLVFTSANNESFGSFRRKLVVLPSSHKAPAKEIVLGMCDFAKEFDGTGLVVSKSFIDEFPAKSAEIIRLCG